MRGFFPFGTLRVRMTAEEAITMTATEAITRVTS
jgi:hypothetical protein